MGLFKDLRQFFHIEHGRLVAKAQCQAFNCGRIFEIKHPDRPLPEMLVCPTCEQRFNWGIKEWLHANTGQVEGNFHLIDGYSKE